MIPIKAILMCDSIFLEVLERIYARKEPIIKSPITKKLTGAFGALTAVFVLISGLSDASKNGKIAVADLKEKLDLAA